MTLEGTWDLVIATPIGRIKPVIDLRYDSQRLTGIAYGAGEQVPLRDIVVDGNQVSWAQSVTKPLRLNLTFYRDDRWRRPQRHLQSWPPALVQGHRPATTRHYARSI
jgi:hypothetical protein